MLAGHSVDLTKHRARRRARNAGVTNGVASLQQRIISFGGTREGERERLLSHRNSTVVGESSTRCELDDERGGFVGGLLHTLWT